MTDHHSKEIQHGHPAQHITINRPADEVWAVVSDAGSISTWFPMVETSSASGEDRHCILKGGVPLEEKIVTNDADLRLFQYRIVGGGVSAQSHLGTVDVLEQGSSCRIV